MKAIKQLLRLWYINYVLAKNGLDQMVAHLHPYAPLRFISYCNPWNWFRKQSLTRGQALRKSLEELGPIFVKFGQALSTRPDIIPSDVAFELSQLQDNVPPFPSEAALHIIQQTFGRSAFDIFASFETTPMASASMAQVHAATLHTGEEVVVKILRPGIEKIVEQDLNLLKTFAALVEKYWPEGRRLKPGELVREFEYSLLGELNLKTEAANAAQLRRNFSGSPILYVPEIYWDYVKENVLVMERIYGIPISDISNLKAAHLNIKKLAENGVEIFFTQVFRDCFFHADMHPGNIFVSPKNKENPQYLCVDFGIIGSLNDKDKRYLAENLYAFFMRDYKKVAKLHIDSGWVPSNTRVELFETAIRTVCEPIFEKPLREISFAQVILGFIQVARRFHMEVQPQLILLQKTLFAVEGLGRQLYPDLDLWATAKPFLEKWLREQTGPKAFFNNLKDNIPFFMEELPYLPKLVYEVLDLKKKDLLQPKTPPLVLQKKSTFSILGIISVLSLSGIALLSWFGGFDKELITGLSLGSAGLIAILMLARIL